MKPNPEQPTCISLILCDTIYRDETTKKLIIVGTFNRVTAPALPTVVPKLTFLFTLTNLNGDYELRLRIEHEKSGQAVAQVRGRLSVTDPLGTVDGHLELNNVQFKDGGKHWIILEADGAILSQRPFWIVPPPSSTAGFGAAP